MNDEIKEILAYFEKYVKTTYMHDSEPMLNWKDLKIVLDYITNLQQENQELNKENEKWWAIIKDNEQEIKDLCLENSKLEQENERLKETIKENTVLVKDENGNYQECNINPLDYKSRIEKAVEYLKERESNTDEYIKTINMSRNCYIIEQEEVIDILNGRSDE